MTVNFSESVFETCTSAGSAKGLSRLLWRFSLPRSMSTWRLPCSSCLTVSMMRVAHLLVLVGEEGATQTESVEGAAIAGREKSVHR